MRAECPYSWRIRSFVIKILEKYGGRLYHQTMGVQPYEKLYIYELGGEHCAGKDAFGGGFVADWREAGYTFLFFSTPAAEAVAAFAADCGAEVRSETVVDYEDWEAGRRLQALEAGRVLVCPVWDVREPAAGQVRILVDPGVAFGSGNHPTTARCLSVLSDLFARERPRTVLDLGCGTGVLTAACLLLGADAATAVELRESCVETAHKTMRLNGLEARSTLINGDAALHAHIPADLLCCNIFFHVIDALTDMPGLFNKKWYVFSGLYAKHADAILPKLTAAGLEIVEHHVDDRWNTILARGN